MTFQDGNDAESLEALVEKWGACGRIAGTAIANRDYEACRKASKEASAIFEKMKSFLGFGSATPAAELKDRIVSCIDIWRKNIESMPEWLDATNAELENVKRRISTRRKIGDVYKKSGEAHSGIRVKVKAR